MTSDCTEAKIPEAAVSPSAGVYMFDTAVVRPVTAEPVASKDEPSSSNTSPLRVVTSDCTEAKIPEAGTTGSTVSSPAV